MAARLAKFFDHFELSRTVLRLGDAPTVTVAPPKRRRQARLGGFDLHADTSVRAKNRPKLERLCRYLLRPPVAEDRLTFAPDGGVLAPPWFVGLLAHQVHAGSRIARY